MNDDLRKETIEFLKKNQWSGDDYDRGGDCYSFCLECHGSEPSSNYGHEGHKPGCGLVTLIEKLENSDNPITQQEVWDSDEIMGLNVSLGLPFDQLFELVKSVENLLKKP